MSDRGAQGVAGEPATASPERNASSTVETSAQAGPQAQDNPGFSQVTGKIYGAPVEDRRVPQPASAPGRP